MPRLMSCLGLTVDVKTNVNMSATSWRGRDKPPAPSGSPGVTKLLLGSFPAPIAILWSRIWRLSTGSAAPGNQVQPDRFRRFADGFHCLVQLFLSTAEPAGPGATLVLLPKRNELSMDARPSSQIRGHGG